VQNEPHAVLIRGIEPLHGINYMMERSGRQVVSAKNGIGPGNVSKLMGIKVAHSGQILNFSENSDTAIWVQDENIVVPEQEFKVGTRIGVDYAAEDALLPYRFMWVKK
jgi:DNA-3-methyladenine glycosylase